MSQHSKDDQENKALNTGENDSEADNENESSSSESEEEEGEEEVFVEPEPAKEPARKKVKSSNLAAMLKDMNESMNTKFLNVDKNQTIMLENLMGLNSRMKSIETRQTNAENVY